MDTLSQFLTPRSRFRGNFTPQNLLFDANLQEFAHRVSLISNLENGGKLAPGEAYQQIETLWEQFKSTVHSSLV